MKVILKTRSDEVEPAERIVESSISQAAPEALREHLAVSRLFPGQLHGNRARMVSLTLPDNTSSTEVQALVDGLARDPRVEYVQIPERKKFLAQN